MFNTISISDLSNVTGGHQCQCTCGQQQQDPSLQMQQPDGGQGMDQGGQLGGQLGGQGGSQAEQILQAIFGLIGQYLQGGGDAGLQPQQPQSGGRMY